MKASCPLPATGGSYLRNPDGSLTPIEAPQDEAAPSEAPADAMPAAAPTPKPTVKRAVKAPAKEG